MIVKEGQTPTKWFLNHPVISDVYSFLRYDEGVHIMHNGKNCQDLSSIDGVEGLHPDGCYQIDHGRKLWNVLVSQGYVTS